MEPITAAISREFERLGADLKDKTERYFRESGGDPSPSVPGDEIASLIRAAAAVEQAFGGLNAQLWDDPFEWTLAEAMNSKDRVLEYFEEVHSELRKGFDRIGSDADLTRDIWTPWGTMTIAELLLRTLSRARTLEGRATASCKRA